MSLLDKIKSMFSGGSSDSTDAPAGNDPAGHDHSPEPAAPPAAPADPMGMPASDAAPSEEGENRLN